MPSRCSFCRSIAHRRPRCHMYETFCTEIGHILNQPWYSTNRVEWCEFYAKHYIKWRGYNYAYNLSDEEFLQNIVQFYVSQMFVYDRIHRRRYIMAQTQSQFVPTHVPVLKPTVQLCVDADECIKSCGVCLSDEISNENIVKFGCGHELCGDCTQQLIEKKPCCPFCRADIKKMCVNSQTVYNIFIEKM